MTDQIIIIDAVATDEAIAPLAAHRAALLDHALAYLQLGWCLLPLQPGTKEPLDRRRGAVWSWVRRHRMDACRARGFFAASGCEIGIITGAPSMDLAVIDIEGEFVEAFRARFNELPNTPITTTPSGGMHIYVNDFSGRPTVNLHLDGVRIGELRRKAPSYVVAPPADGRRWLTAPPWELRLAYVPSWVTDLIERPRRRSSTSTPRQRAADRPREEDLPPVGLRVRYARERLASGIVPAAVQGNDGHTALLRAAVEVVRGFCIPTGDGLNNHAFDVLWEAFNPLCVPPWTAGEDHQLIHKIDEAYYKGEQDWGGLLDYRLAFERDSATGAAAATNAAISMEAPGAGATAAAAAVDRSDRDHGKSLGAEKYDITNGVIGDAGAKRRMTGTPLLVPTFTPAPPTLHGGGVISFSAPSAPSARASTATVSTIPILPTASSLTQLVIGASSLRISSPSSPLPASSPTSPTSSLPAAALSPSRRPRQQPSSTPRRAIPPADLVRLLHSPLRVAAETGWLPPPKGKFDTLADLAFAIALGCYYAGADFESTRALLMVVRGGIAVQQAPVPDVYARELFLDAWRAYDRQLANAQIMIVDKVLTDPDPDPSKTRALSRATFKLRTIDKPKTETYEHQTSWTIPIRLGPPNSGQISGEWIEARTACDAGALPERRRRRLPDESWHEAVVLAVVIETADGKKKVRHLLPVAAAEAAAIRGALGVCAAFAQLRQPAARLHPCEAPRAGAHEPEVDPT